MRRAANPFLALIFLLALASPAAADDSEVETLRAQLRSTVLQLRQLQDQQAASQAAPAAASPDVAALKAKLAAAQREAQVARRSAGEFAGLEASLASAQSQNSALTSAATASAAELDRYKASYNQAAEAVRDLTAERDRLKAQLALSSNIASACATKNARLIAFAEDLLAAYDKVGLGQVLAAHEPLIGYRRVQLENIAQDHEDVVRTDRCDARIDARASAKPASAPNP